LNPDGVRSLADQIMQRAAKVCPVEHSEVIEGRPAKGGIIVPTVNDLKRVDWPEALFLIMHKTRLSYTFESPSDFPLAPRVNALVAATTAAVEAATGMA
jgi:murein peptide amidase A